MGYGFVKFKKSWDAKEAIKSLQGRELDGHCLEIKFSNRTGSIDSVKRKTSTTTKQKSSKILVRNIPFEAKTKEIEELFKVFGELKYVRLPKKIDGAHRGFGFVDFVTQSDAEILFKVFVKLKKNSTNYLRPKKNIIYFIVFFDRAGLPRYNFKSNSTFCTLIPYYICLSLIFYLFICIKLFIYFEQFIEHLSSVQKIELNSSGKKEEISKIYAVSLRFESYVDHFLDYLNQKYFPKFSHYRLIIIQRAFDALSHSTHFFGRRLVLEWAEPEQSQDVEILRQKEEQLSGSKNKRLKKSKILDDLGREEDDLRMDVGTEN
ncbi:putative RNA-binding 19 [Brachionus plicatilis]|uniref:Putative RNA-binding 19 n=1 Tax=Brachionus plicatilis TaxID=10195 RepID=A0A3M7QA56_BRAPC|nr:putative RNA-binding 19 [Brachionus plicatilis]